MGGGYKKMLGGVNMRKAKIYIKKHEKTWKYSENWEGVVPQLGGLYNPVRGVKNPQLGDPTLSIVNVFSCFFMFFNVNLSFAHVAVTYRNHMKEF